MVKQVLATAAVAALSTALCAGLSAQEDVIAKRQEIMKENGRMAKLGGQMAKGEVPFDLAKAKAIFADFDKAAGEFPNLFPDNSKTGGKTTASPKIWEDMADFKKRFADWSAEVQKASADTHDLDSFKAGFSQVTKACGSCHQVYRIKTS